MGSYSIVVSLLILFFVPMFELARKKYRKIDFLSFINLVFLLAYGVAPTYIYIFPQKTKEWRFLLNDNLIDIKFVIGILLAVLFYFIMVIAYYFSHRFVLTKKLKTSSAKIFSLKNNNVLFKPAFVLFIMGSTSLILYINVVGGFENYLQLGRILRSDSNYIQHPLMFLVHFTNLLMISSFIFFSLFKYSTGLTKFYNLTFFIISTFGSMLVVYHSNGRLTLVTYILTFPIALLLYKNKIKIKTILLSFSIFFLIIIYGNDLFDFEENIEMNFQKTDVFNSIISEFSFPFINIANAFDLFPNTITFRGGIFDVLKAFIELIPSRIINVNLLKGETIDQFNTSLYEGGGTVPADIISFGYMSFGVVGVIIVAFIFGIIIRCIEDLLSYQNNLVAVMFYTSLGFFLSFRIMYGDPVKIVKDIFPYLVALAFVILFTKLTISKKYN